MNNKKLTSTNSNYRIEFTDRQINIPGFFDFGRQIMMSAEQPISIHKHPNCFEFVIASSGTFEFSVSKKEYSISGNEIFMSLPDELHSSAKSPLSVGEFFWIQIDISRIQDFLFLNKESADDLKQGLFSISNRVIETKNREIVELCNSIYEMLIGKTLTASKYKISHYVVFLLERIIDETKTRKESLSNDIKAVLDFIKDNIYEEISIDKLAEFKNLSATYFKLKFKAQMGISPGNYINKEKIKIAKKLLEEGKNITETGALLGYSTPSYFSSVFKKYTTMTPTEYLNKIKEGQSKV